MKITAIKAAVKTQGRYNIFVDGAYNFSLDEFQLIHLGVRLGREYTEAELEQLKEESVFGKAYARALEYIMRRPRSEKELRDYAWRKQWDPALADRVIERLRAKGHVDDATFAQAWVRHRALGKPISTRKLQMELRQKGVADEHVTAALAVDKDFDEKDALRRLVAKKRARYPDRQKFLAYLMRQGYGYDDVKSAVDGTEDEEL
ncbi:RecX family transcriptional regulator [Candidatus Saccharibacteria bacterium]|nr:RecX family transcriptional regulator [Candidatus Saccharibacteria bacterium]